MAEKLPPNPITPEHAEKFRGAMLAWRERLGLHGWRYVKSRRPSKELAEISEQLTEHRLVRWALGTDWGGTEIDDESLESTACHENLHVLLHRLLEVSFAEQEYNDTVMGEEHGVIAVLEQLLYRGAVAERELAALKSTMKATNGITD